MPVIVRNRLAAQGLRALCFFLLLADGAAHAQDYADQLVEKASQERLADDRYWDVLLHYMPVRGGRKSLVDDPKFFCASTGKTDPAAELDATIRSFFELMPETPPASEGNSEPEPEHPRCRFPARYEWMKERLAIDEARLPAVSCARLEDGIRRFAPKGTTLVFPATHPNSPASMFGHTLIRVDAETGGPLLSHAVTYAAYTEGEDRGMFYALKGLFGYFRGYYSILPYYEKIREYNDVDHRDLWEYPLNLTPAETRRMVLHVWELKDIYSDYFFFDENCSYNLLFLLEAARPSARLTDRFWYQVIPVDTIRVIDDEGLISGVDYRPSLVTRVRHTAGLLPPERRALLDDAARGRVAAASVSAAEMPSDEKARILDASAEYTQYQLARQEIAKDEYTRRFYGILKERSRIQTPAAIPPPVPARPEEGHRSVRVQAGAGVSSQDEAFIQLAWRPAYHDLLNDDAGYEEGSEVRFLDVAVRLTGGGAIRLQELALIDIVSLSPVDGLFNPTSWEIRSGLVRRPVRHGTAVLAHAMPGFGYAARLAGAIVYGLAEAEALAGGGLREGYAVGAGASVGLVAKPLDGIKVHIEGRAMGYPLGDQHSRLTGMVGISRTLGRDSSLRLQFQAEQSFGNGSNEALLAFDLFL